MKITESMMNYALENYTKADYPFHFKPYNEEDIEMNQYLANAFSNYAKEAYGNQVLAYMKTSISPIELISRGYLITPSFVYFDEGKPIYIESIKKVTQNQGLITIEYLNGGKKVYHGGTFYLELYNLLCYLIQEDTQEEKSSKEAMEEAILTYYDDGGYEFQLASRINPSIISNLERKATNGKKIIGMLDCSILKNGTKGFIITEDQIYSDFLISHKQAPIDLTILKRVEAIQNRLVLYHIDGTKRAVYVSVYGHDLENLINLYLKVKTI